MKKKTMISRVVSVMLAAMLVFGLAACGKGGDGDKGGSDSKVEYGTNADDDTQKEDKEEKKEPEVTYSFEGAYASGASDVRFEWVLNMYDDGTLTVEPGLVFLDVEDHEDTATGTWSEADGVLSFNMENEDGTFTREYELEKDENGGYLFGMEVSLASFVRPIEMRCVTEGFVPAGEAQDSSFN